MDSTKTQALDAALATLPQRQFFPPPPTVAAALGDLTAAALERAKLWRLDCVDGTFLCAECGGTCPFHVSLHCEFCLQEYRNKRVQRLLREAGRSWEDLRWEGMARNIARVLDAEVGLRLIDKASNLPSSTPERMQALRLVYERRWQPRDGGATYAAASAQEDPAELWERD